MQFHLTPRSAAGAVQQVHAGAEFTSWIHGSEHHGQGSLAKARSVVSRFKSHSGKSSPARKLPVGPRSAGGLLPSHGLLNITQTWFCLPRLTGIAETIKYVACGTMAEEFGYQFV
jgi:hypothetical protein